MVFHSAVYQGSLLGVMPDAPRDRRAPGPRRQLHLIGDVAGHHETEALAGLRGDEHRVAELRLRGRRSVCAARLAVADSCFISVRWAKYVRTGPAMVSVRTHTTAARMAARRAVNPNRSSERCSSR
jgi:hypothetical protein